MRQKLVFLAATFLSHIGDVVAQEASVWKQFTAFAYCSGTRTSTGAVPLQGLTVAADPSVLPLGSRILITGAEQYSGIYTVSDTGSKIRGRVIDIYMNSREAAIQFGRKFVDVRILQVAAADAD